MTSASPSASSMNHCLASLRSLHIRRAAQAQRLQICFEFLDQHGVPGMLDDAYMLGEFISLTLYLLSAEKPSIVVDLLSLAAQRRQDTGLQVILRERGTLSMLIFLNVFDWRVLAFWPQFSLLRKEARLQSAPDSAKDQIFPMMLRVYHAELNTKARGCLHIVFALGSKSNLLELLCAGADKWAPFPGRTSVTVPDPDDESNIDVGTNVEIAPGQSTMDVARKYKDQLDDSKFRLLSTFELTLQDMCLIAVRKHVGLLSRERISALPLPGNMQRKLL